MSFNILNDSERKDSKVKWGYLVTRVVDRGMGIEKNVMHKLF